MEANRLDRVCRSATCAETRAIVDLEDELFALRHQWSEMLGNSAAENSPDEMARLIPGACVTDSNGLYDKMQHTVIIPKGKERRVDVECLALKEGLDTSSNKFFLGTLCSTTGQQSHQRHRSGTFCILLEKWATLESGI